MLRFVLKELSERIEKYSCPCPAVKAQRTAEAQFHSVVTLVLDAAEWSTLCSGRRYLEKEPRYSQNSELDGPQSLSGCCEEDKSLLPLRKYRTCIVQLAA